MDSRVLSARLRSRSPAGGRPTSSRCDVVTRSRGHAGRVPVLPRVAGNRCSLMSHGPFGKMIFLSNMIASELNPKAPWHAGYVLDRGRGAAAVGAGQDFQEVAVRVFEVQAAAGVAVVDGLAAGPGRIGPVGQVPLAEAVEGGVELDLADQERIVLWRDRAGGLGEIEGDGVVRLHHEKVGEAGRRGQAEDLAEERRRALLVTAGNDGVVQLDAHAVLPVSWRCISSMSLVRPRMGRTITVKLTSWSSSFQRSMSTPWTYRPSSSASNSSTALDGPHHSST